MTQTNQEAGIKDVARLAGVSVGTVSNVLNRPEAVSEEKRKLVAAAITELSYVPNDAARQLKAGISRTLGLIVVDTQNPFYGDIAMAAESAVDQHSLGLFVANSHQRLEREEFYLSQFEQQRVRGILVTPGSANLERHRAVSRRGTRIVLVDAVEPDPDFCTVSADDFKGGQLAMGHLIEQGRKRIAIIGGPARFRQVGRRRAGALAAAEGMGVEITYLEPDEMTILAGRTLGEHILDGPDPLPDAIFAMNDLLATGVLQALVMRRRFDVPGDVALIGYDDIDFCQSAVVPMSSVRQPSAQMGREAVDLLQAEVDEGRGHRHRSVTHEPELVVRESTVGRP